MRLLLFIILITSFGSFYAQFEDENTLPNRYYVNVLELKTKIETSTPPEFKEDKLLHISHEFANNQAYFISKLITGGNIYTNNREFETYLNEILKTILPPELKDKPNIKVYLVKKGTFNASMTASGHLFLNIGVFSKVNNEATLASILAHEVAHYYQNHLIQAFIHKEKKTFEGYLGSEKVESKFYMNNELEADSLSFLWMNSSSYSTLGCIENYRIIERLEKQQSKRNPYLSNPKSRTHPIADVRLKKIERFIHSNKNADGKLFLISEEKFNRFKNEAKEEILNQLLNNLDYSECAELAFFEHAKTPKEKIYLYYLMESIRRRCYLRDNEWSENFITNMYYVDTVKNAIGKRDEVFKPLLQELDTVMLGLSSLDASKINRKYYFNGNMIFKTNEEAFIFFANLGNSLECDECIFSNALSYSNFKPARDSLLNKYIALKNKPQFYEFAKVLINDSVYNSLPNAKLLVYSDIVVQISQGNTVIPVEAINSETVLLQENIFKHVIEKFDNRNFLHLEGLKENQLQDYKLFKQLQDYSSFGTVSKRRNETHILDSKYYYLFKKYGVNEIEFIQTKYNEYRKKEKSIKAYHDVLPTDLSQVIKQKDITRYLEIQISSVREIKNSISKVRFYGHQVQLPFKGLGKYLIEYELEKQLILKDNYTQYLHQMAAKE